MELSIDSKANDASSFFGNREFGRSWLRDCI